MTHRAVTQLLRLLTVGRRVTLNYSDVNVPSRYLQGKMFSLKIALFKVD